VSFSIFKGEILGLVGESGSGKTTVARLIMRLIKPTENSVYFEGEDIFNASGTRLEQIRKEIAPGHFAACHRAQSLDLASVVISSN
jgi:ABC-type oligopeptide transport system ATPase subunit